MVAPLQRFVQNTLLRPFRSEEPRPPPPPPQPTAGPTPKPVDSFEQPKAARPTPSPSPGPSPTPPPAPAAPQPLTPISTDPTNPTPEMVVRPSKNFNDRPAGQDIDSIVLHHTADPSDESSLETLTGKPTSFMGWLESKYKDVTGRGDVSSHYVIGKEGTIYQLVGDEKRAWHAGEGSLPGKPGDVNDRSIGIEIVNEGDGKDGYTEAQYKALEQLVPYLAKRYDVPADNLVGHKDITDKKQDPSPNFDFDRIRRATEAKN
ncbi:N-acetylmuramoyl-L-alanine amidase [Myxococcus sp. CA056]|uniref:N-acetylmuramoyl-L-alanine amidase n=1 Tax=unclassified Myxococcus TaxID=2648731 RepID=UPI00157A4EC2|nr:MULTISPECIES: N-acetylmuramoyl-L-alanine amidase [unclassified Myxococcus]NTX10726.1 N-acetylmuramoyl-L-alanine amidase [Myxococcus sp. CA056]NTX56632.1 N-acetylmuramoyl-L-alanine amidase [Myxococcus sp. CA039A]